MGWTYVWFSPFGDINHDTALNATMNMKPITRDQLSEDSVSVDLACAAPYLTRSGTNRVEAMGIAGLEVDLPVRHDD